MTANSAPLALFIPAFTGFIAGTSSRPWGYKDLSAGGACETGYGDQTKIHSGLQFLTDLKHSEKHTPYIRWTVVTVVPMLLEVLPGILQRNTKRRRDSDAPVPIHTLPKERLGNISARQLGFLLSIVPLYHNTRALKNFIWPGPGFDPSGHTMFKVAQYGMLYSMTTDHGTKSRINNATVCYIAFTTIADAIMLNNTIANCHTLAEIAAGGAMGVAVLIAAHLVSKHTPLGEYVEKAARVAANAVYDLGSSLINGVRHGLLAFQYTPSLIL